MAEALPLPPAEGALGDAQLLLRKALGRFATGVSVVTCVDEEGAPVGLTANSFTALSLEPPLVLWALRRASDKLQAFMQCAHFTVNVLTEAQIGVSRCFASKTVADRFAEGRWATGLGGVPRLEDCAAVFECEAMVQRVAGDHMLFIGRVARHHMPQPTAPLLLFHAGHYHRLGERMP